MTRTFAQTLPVPWRRVLTSTQLWGPFLTSFGSDWGFYTFLTLGPKYMASILGVDIKQVIFVADYAHWKN